MVRLSAVLCSVRYSYRQKAVLKKKGHYRVNQIPTVASSILEDSGVEVADPRNYLHPPPEKWKPPSGILQDFRLKKALEQTSLAAGKLNLPRHASYTDEKTASPHREAQQPIWHVSPRISFTEGVNQACLLTKTQPFNGLPPQIKKLLGKYSLECQDDMIRDVIHHSQVWNNTMEKLPRHKDIAHFGWHFSRQHGIPDSKSAHILLNNFLRLSQSMCGTFPDLATQRRVFCKPSIETSYQYHGETIQITTVNEFMVVGHRPLTQFGDEGLISRSEASKPWDMYPILPTVDLQQRTNYRRAAGGALYQVLEVPCSHPQMVLRVNSGSRNAKTHQAFNLMSTFGIAIAEAKSRYGTISGQLETPVTVINVNSTHNVLSFIVFQLNTMDFDDHSGIKNFAWFDSGKLFSKTHCQPWLDQKKRVTPPAISDYDHEVFQKFLALYLYDYVE